MASGTIKHAAVNHVGGSRKILVSVEVDFPREFKAGDLSKLDGLAVSLPFELEKKAEPKPEAK